MNAYQNTGLQHHGEPVDHGDPVEVILDNYRRDPRKIAEARAYISGTLDGEQYFDLERLLDQLHDIDPDQIVGSDTLAGLYRLAETYRGMRDRWLMEMAEDDVARGEA